MAWTEIIHADADALAAAVAARLGAALDEALRLRQRAVLALAGGRTSPPVFRRLAAQPRDWRSVTLLPSDERWVAANHPDCNLSQLQAAFSAAHGMHWIGLAPPRPSGAPDASYANTELAPFAAAFDAALLGMGADGHVASLFPGAPTLARALDAATEEAAIAIAPDPLPVAGPHPRISLTLARLLHSRCVLLALTGGDKLDVLRRAQREMSDRSRLPVAALLHAPASRVEIHWSP